MNANAKSPKKTIGQPRSSEQVTIVVLRNTTPCQGLAFRVFNFSLFWPGSGRFQSADRDTCH
jgi:hypothetical protein